MVTFNQFVQENDWTTRLYGVLLQWTRNPVKYMYVTELGMNFASQQESETALLPIYGKPRYFYGRFDQMLNVQGWEKIGSF